MGQYTTTVAELTFTQTDDEGSGQDRTRQYTVAIADAF